MVKLVHEWKYLNLDEDDKWHTYRYSPYLNPSISMIFDVLSHPTEIREGMENIR